MCGRFTLTKQDFSELVALLGAEAPPEYAALYRPRYNIAPTDQHWILRVKREQRQLLPARWGLVNSWAKDARRAAAQINARSETAAKTPAFREAFERRRCAVPADGFFEWLGTKAARRPVWFHAADGGLLLFAALYESWRDPATDTWLRTFTILTTDANDVVSPVHDRMPVILPPAVIDDWLYVPPSGTSANASVARAALKPAADDVLVATEVSLRVNSVKYDDPACLEPTLAAPNASQGRLI